MRVPGARRGSPSESGRITQRARSNGQLDLGPPDRERDRRNDHRFPAEEGAEIEQESLELCSVPLDGHEEFHRQGLVLRKHAVLAGGKRRRIGVQLEEPVVHPRPPDAGAGLAGTISARSSVNVKVRPFWETSALTMSR